MSTEQKSLRSNGPANDEATTFFKTATQEIKKEIKGLSARFSSLESSQQLISDKHDDFIKKFDLIFVKLEECSRSNANLKAELDLVKEENAKKNLKIQFLEDRIAEQEQYSRRRQIEIRELAHSPRESIEEIVIKTADVLGVKISHDDIEAAHRLRAAPGKTPGIIVAFSNRKTREKILRAKQDSTTKRAKLITNDDILNNGSRQKVYVGESLSAHYKTLLRDAKAAGKAANYKFIWWKGSSVKARKTTTSQILNIQTIEDIQLIK